jgi:hypothetical protein
LENEGKGLESCVEDKAPGTMSIHLQRYVHDWLPSGLQAATLVFFCVRIESIDHAMLLTQFGGKSTSLSLYNYGGRTFPPTSIGSLSSWPDQVISKQRH